jgi:predicted kinase
MLYDLAFLIMDLAERGLGADANRLFNRYVLDSPDPVLTLDGLAAFPVFLALRAAIRAKIAALRGPEDAVQAKAALAYFAAAERFIAPAPPLLVAIGGLSGSGKTSLAQHLAPALGRAPGALHLRSDVERKRRAGVPETTTLPDAAYTAEAAAALYRRLQDLAEHGLRAGQAVILDAVQGRLEEQAAAATLAARLGVPFCGFWLDAPVALLTARVAARRADASDATPAVVEGQVAAGFSAPGWIRLDAGQPIERLAASLLRNLPPV